MEGMTQFQKYKYNLTCSDNDSLGFAEVSSARDGIWPGARFTLTCLPGLGAEEAMTFQVMLLSPGWQETRDELEAITGWSLDFEQV
jgi:hypothetical protein